MALLSWLFGCIRNNGDVEIDDRHFKIQRSIADGGFGQVFLIQESKSKKEWALKRIDCHSNVEKARVYRELDVHNRLASNKRILRLECFSEVQIGDRYRFSLVFPFFERGSLEDELITRKKSSDFIDEVRIVYLFKQIVEAVSLLHDLSPSIMHRDVKPGNVLLSSEDQPVLMDFGSCCKCPIVVNNSKEARHQMDEAAELCSMLYRAPELFFCESGSIITQAVDIWSLGCLLYALCFFHSPFDEVHQRGDSVALAVQSANFKFPKEHPFTEKVINLMRKIIQVNPSQRPNTYEILEELNETL